MAKKVTITLPESQPRFRATRQRLTVGVDGTIVFGPEELGLDVRNHVLRGLEEGQNVGVEHAFADKAGNWSPTTSTQFMIEDRTAPEAPGEATFLVEDEPEEPPAPTPEPTPEPAPEPVT